MIQELVNRIVEAEAEAEKAVQGAFAAAKELYADAENRSAEIVSEAKRLAKAERQRVVREAEETAEREYNRIVTEGVRAAEKKTAGLDIESAADFIVEKLKEKYVGC